MIPGDVFAEWFELRYTMNRRNTTVFRPWIRAVTQCHVQPTPTGPDIPPLSNTKFYKQSEYK